MRDPVELIGLYCRDGDAAAFREFYRAQAPRLWKYLVARGCAPEDAYDLLSESFMRFVERVCRDPRAPGRPSRCRSKPTMARTCRRGKKPSTCVNW